MIRSLALPIRIALLGLATVLAAPGAGGQAQTQDDSSAAKAAIVERLRRWTAAFNAKELVGICDLFAPDLSYTVDDVADGSRDRLCANIDKALANPGLRLRYDPPDIREIIVSGDLAVVRLTWTLAAENGHARSVTREEGMDIFRRQPDGRWSIARYIAFSTRPNAVVKSDAPP